MRCRTTDQPALSGFNHYWTSNLPDLTAEQCREYLARIAEMPLKMCDATVGCEAVVTTYVDFHGCDGITVCTGHLQVWLFEINRALSEQGEIPCTDCGQSFSDMGSIMKARPI